MAYSLRTERRTLADVDLRNPLNKNHPLNYGRVAWWNTLPGRFGGSVWWDLVSVLPGTLTGFTSNAWNLQSYAGGAGSLLFNASPKVVCPQPSCFLGSAARSITVWFSTQIASSSSCLYGFGINNGTGNIVHLQIETGGVLFVRCFNIVNSYGSGYNDGKWHCCTITYPKGGTGSQIACIVDGVLLSTTVVTGGTLTLNTLNGHLNIGSVADGNSAPAYTGYLSDFSVHNYPLPLSLHQQAFRLGPQGYPGVLNKRRRTAWFLAQTISPPPSSSRPIAAYTRQGVMIGTGIF